MTLPARVFIRPITLEDADGVERVYRQSAALLRSLGADTELRFSADVYRRDGFGDCPAFSGVAAILDDELVGYLLYTFGYDPDGPMRYLFVIDLAVEEQVRRRGIGRALMERAAAICREADGAELFWAVFPKNESALAFYRGLGAADVLGLQFMTRSARNYL